MVHLTDEEVAVLEVANGLRQYDYGIDAIKFYLAPECPFQLRTSLILELQAIAVQGLVDEPGTWRKTSVTISKSEHAPPDAFQVPLLVQELCDYINDNWHERSGLHLAAYVMWRLNWIHPFSDGNGRTSRMLSYIVLSVKSGLVLPGVPTIPQQIQDDRTLYFRALEHADKVVKETGKLDLTDMECLLRDMLAKQLLSVIEQANGGPVAIGDSAALPAV